MNGKGVRSPQSGGKGSWKGVARRWRRGVPLMMVALVATACSSSTSGGSPGGSSSFSCSPGGRPQGTGVTSTCITVGQVDDLTLPLPGLFKGAEDGTQAYIDYTNSLGGVNGRKIKLDAEDSAFQGGQVASETAAQIQHDFALVGGFSLLDSSEQPFIDAARMPDVGFSLSPALARDPNVYSALPNPIEDYPVGLFKYLKKRYPQAVKHVGIIWENATASTKSSEDAFEAAMKSQGFKILYDRGAGPFDTNFLSDILAMKNANVQMFFAVELPDNYAAELATQFQQQNFKPINIEGAAYSNQLVSLGGSAVNNMYIEQGYALYLGQDAKTVPAVKLFDTWMKKADPKANFEIRVGLRLDLGRVVRPGAAPGGQPAHPQQSAGRTGQGHVLRRRRPRPDGEPRQGRGVGLLLDGPDTKRSDQAGRPLADVGVLLPGGRILQGARLHPDGPAGTVRERGRWRGPSRRPRRSRTQRARRDRVPELPDRRRRDGGHLRRERQRPGGDVQHHRHLQLRPGRHGDGAGLSLLAAVAGVGPNASLRWSSRCSWPPPCWAPSSNGP